MTDWWLTLNSVHKAQSHSKQPRVSFTLGPHSNVCKHQMAQLCTSCTPLLHVCLVRTWPSVCRKHRHQGVVQLRHTGASCTTCSGRHCLLTSTQCKLPPHVGGQLQVIHGDIHSTLWRRALVLNVQSNNHTNTTVAIEVTVLFCTFSCMYYV